MHVETLLSVKGGALIIMSGPSPKLDHPRRPRTYVYPTSTPPCTTHYLILQPLSSCFMPGAGIAKINKAQALPEDLTERQETFCYDWVWSVLWQRNTRGTDEGPVRSTSEPSRGAARAAPQRRWVLKHVHWVLGLRGEREKVFQAVCVEAGNQGNTECDERVILIGWRTRYMRSWEERRKNAVSIATAVNVQCSLPTCWKQFWHFKHNSFNL